MKPKSEARKLITRVLSSALAAVAILLLVPHPGSGFTQSGLGVGFGNGIPMGHEWITRLAALELLGGDPVIKPDPNDPRKRWTQGLAKNPDISSPGAQREAARIRALSFASDHRYESAYKPVYDTIMGERWVDIGGFNVTKAKLGSYDCWDAVAQEPAEVQYDHFMRRWDEYAGPGGVSAAKGSQSRFLDYFVAAATAPRAQIKTFDGGGWSQAVTVDQNYFLFGRALHLFQDSFSSEHTVRDPADNFVKLLQVKSYLCAAGSEQHSHSTAAVLNYTSGDVVWLPSSRGTSGWSSYKPSNMKTTALVATEATIDLWAAFIRVMGHPPAQRQSEARREALVLIANWLSFDPTEMAKWYDDESHRGDTYVIAKGQTGKGMSVETCMAGLKVGTVVPAERVAQLEEAQRVCIYNVESQPGYVDLFDPSLHIPLYWQWTSQTHWKRPPPDWKIPQRAKGLGSYVRIQSVENEQYMTAPDGLLNNSWVYCKPGTPLDFTRVQGSPGGDYFRLRDQPDLFLSYRAASGAVKLYASASEAGYNLLTPPPFSSYTIFNNTTRNLMWLYRESPYLTSAGDGKNKNARWILEPQPANPEEPVIEP